MCVCECVQTCVYDSLFINIDQSLQNIFYLLSSDEHFVDKYWSELIEMVSDVEPILNELLHRNVIQQESYDKIKTLPTAEEKMRELISGPLKSSGVQGKDIFYEILIENEPLLIQDLKKMDAEVSKSYLYKSV